MNNSTHVSKVFLDSRYTLPDGSFAIPGESILLTPDTRCWLSEFTGVCSWDTLDYSNRFFTVFENGTDRLVGLEAGPHDLESLRTAMETSLNAPNKTAGVGTYTVERVSTGTGGSTFRAFRVSLSSGTFRIPAENNTLKSIVGFPTVDTAAAVHTSGFVDVRRVHSILLHRQPQLCVSHWKPQRFGEDSCDCRLRRAYPVHEQWPGARLRGMRLVCPVHVACRAQGRCGLPAGQERHFVLVDSGF